MAGFCPAHPDPLCPRRLLKAAIALAGAGAVLAFAAMAPTLLRAHVTHTSPEVAAAPTAPSRQGLDPAELVGRWVDPVSGKALIVTAHGQVWSDSGERQGVAEPPHADANFAFGSGTYRCDYQVTLRSQTVAAWRLIEQAPANGPCPSGTFRRPPPF